MTNNFLKNNKTLERIFRLSGKDYNDLGRYEDCLKLEDEEFRYVLAAVPKAFPIPMMVGLCVPSVCTIQEFNNYKPYLVNSINRWIPEIFQGIKGFDLSMQLNTVDLVFEDSKIKNEEATSGDIASFALIIVIALFTITVIVCSFKSWKQ